MARLLSPVVCSPDSDLCMSFWYHMFGSHIGTLRIKQRKQTVDGKADILLWTVSGHQGNRWREGRVLLPRTNQPYQVSRDLSLGFFGRSVVRFERHCCVKRLLSAYLSKSVLSNSLFFKVVIESLVDGKSWGDISVDDIRVLDGVGLTDCKGEA